MPTEDDYKAMKEDGQMLLSIAEKGSLEDEDLDNINMIGTRMVDFSSLMLGEESEEESEGSDDMEEEGEESDDKDAIIIALKKALDE